MRVHTQSSIAAAVAAAVASASASAADVAYQNFLFAVCGGAPSGALAVRCASTPAGLGNISGDSESSLNPSQGLNRNQPAVGVALTRSKAARERGERRHDERRAEARSADGRLALLLDIHATDTERRSSDQTISRGFDGSSKALELGLDFRVSDRTVVGALLGAEKADYDFDAEAPGVNFVPAAKAGDTDSDNRYLTLFGSWSMGPAGFVELSAGYERSDGKYRRFSVFQESTRTLAQTAVAVEGKADGTVHWLSANGGYDFSRDSWSVGPYAGITTVRARLDGYEERDLGNSGLNMRFSSTTRKALLAHAGVRASYTLSGKAGVFVPQLRVEWQRDFNQDTDSLSASFVLDPRNTPLALSGARWDRDGLNAGFSISTVLPNGWMPYLDYAVLLGYRDVRRQRATLGLRVEF